MDRELLNLLELIEQSDYVTAEQLAQHIQKSEKTTRTRLKALRQNLAESGAELVSKPRHGYRLEINDAERYHAWRQRSLQRIARHTPETAEERLMYLVERFISGSFFKLADESEALFVSTKTLSQEIRHAESILTRSGLTVERVPGYGMRAIGDEFAFRKAIMHCLRFHTVGFDDCRSVQDQAAAIIGDLVVQTFAAENVVMSEAALETFILYLVVSSARCHRGHIIEDVSGRNTWEGAEHDRHCAHVVIEQLEEHDIPLDDTEGEVQLIAAFVAGGVVRHDAFGLDGNLVISEDIQRLIDPMLDAIYDMYGVDFSDNLRLRLMLGNHLIAFDIRMRYGIEITNPLLAETRRTYPFAHALAQQAALPLAAHYGRPVSEHEIAYFTIMFQMGLVMQRRIPHKSRVLLVCATGKSSSRFFAYQFEEAFGDYISELTVCSVFELNDIDLNTFDYIFSSVPIDRAVPKPIMQVNSFLETRDMNRVRRRLELGDSSYLRRFYRPEFFFTGLTSRRRDDALAELCELVRQVRPLPDNFLGSVLEREKHGSTDFGNLAALPHPVEVLPDENLVVVGVLKRPIRWKTNDVQLIILTSICDSTADETQRFYQTTARLLTDEKRVRCIVEGGNYETLMRALCG